MFSFFNRFKSIETQRIELLKTVNDSPLKNYLSVPFPDNSKKILELEILSLDFETTGLNAKKDKLLSVGCVDIQQGKIKLCSCSHQVINVDQQLDKNNVAIHQITDSEKEQGASLKSALDDLLEKMTGKIVLVHYAQIERHFIQQACSQIYGVMPPLLIIDTLAIIKKRFDLSDTAYDPSKLRLSNLRESYQLPAYSSHNALSDAISTAELLLAEVHHHKHGLKTRLKELI